MIWIALGAIATFAIKYAYDHNSGGITYDNQQRYLGMARLASGVLIGLSLLWLLFRVVPTWRRYYALVIETAPRTVSASCTDSTGNRTDSTHGAGITRRPGPHPEAPRPRILLLCVTLLMKWIPPASGHDARADG